MDSQAEVGVLLKKGSAKPDLNSEASLIELTCHSKGVKLLPEWTR